MGHARKCLFVSLVTVGMYGCGDGGSLESPGEVPANADELFQFLKDGAYQDYAAESGVHGSEGPHGDVRTYVDPILEESLGEPMEHPAGAAAIKELYDGDTVSGWAVSVKVDEESQDGDGWYWYEVFSVDDNDPVVDGTGIGSCTGCHSGGNDFVMTPSPLQ